MHEGYEPIPCRTEEAASDVVDAAIAVHRILGPGLLESAYEVCLTRIGEAGPVGSKTGGASRGV
jgi:hypothetical protein